MKSRYGWILAKFLFCVFMDETESRSINSHTKKKNEANIQTSCLTEQVWSIKAGSSLASRECAWEPLPRPIPFAHGVTTLRLARRIFFRPGARFSKAPETFWARKAIFSSSVFLKGLYNQGGSSLAESVRTMHL